MLKYMHCFKFNRMRKGMKIFDKFFNNNDVQVISIDKLGMPTKNSVSIAATVLFAATALVAPHGAEARSGEGNLILFALTVLAAQQQHHAHVEKHNKHTANEPLKKSIKEEPRSHALKDPEEGFKAKGLPFKFNPDHKIEKIEVAQNMEHGMKR